MQDSLVFDFNAVCIMVFVTFPCILHTTLCLIHAQWTYQTDNFTSRHYVVVPCALVHLVYVALQWCCPARRRRKGRSLSHRNPLNGPTSNHHKASHRTNAFNICRVVLIKTSVFIIAIVKLIFIYVMHVASCTVNCASFSSKGACPSKLEDVTFGSEFISCGLLEH